MKRLCNGARRSRPPISRLPHPTARARRSRLPTRHTIPLAAWALPDAPPQSCSSPAQLETGPSTNPRRSQPSGSHATSTSQPSANQHADAFCDNAWRAAYPQLIDRSALLIAKPPTCGVTTGSQDLCLLHQNREHTRRGRWCRRGCAGWGVARWRLSVASPPHRAEPVGRPIDSIDRHIGPWDSYIARGRMRPISEAGITSLGIVNDPRRRSVT